MSFGNHSLIYCNDGRMLVFGSNEKNQLGIKDFEDQTKPIQLIKDESLKLIACGGSFSFFYNEKEELWGFGGNGDGQLGLEKKIEKVSEPTLLMKNVKLKQLCCGEAHAMFLTENGEVFATGYNSAGQLGIGNFENQFGFISVIKDEKIKKLLCGGYSSFIWKKNGEVFVFGEGHNGRLGLGNTKDQNTPVLLMKEEKIKKIVCGGCHSGIYFSTGELFMFGWNERGQLGLGDFKDN